MRRLRPLLYHTIFAHREAAEASLRSELDLGPEERGTLWARSREAEQAADDATRRYVEKLQSEVAGRLR